jgi:hypothetical protein
LQAVNAIQMLVVQRMLKKTAIGIITASMIAGAMTFAFAQGAGGAGGAAGGGAAGGAGAAAGGAGGGGTGTDDTGRSGR